MATPDDPTEIYDTDQPVSSFGKQLKASEVQEYNPREHFKQYWNKRDLSSYNDIEKRLAAYIMD